MINPKSPIRFLISLWFCESRSLSENMCKRKWLTSSVLLFFCCQSPSNVRLFVTPMDSSMPGLPNGFIRWLKKYMFFSIFLFVHLKNRAPGCLFICYFTSSSHVFKKSAISLLCHFAHLKPNFVNACVCNFNSLEMRSMCEIPIFPSIKFRLPEIT